MPGCRGEYSARLGSCGCECLYMGEYMPGWGGHVWGSNYGQPAYVTPYCILVRLAYCEGVKL